MTFGDVERAFTRFTDHTKACIPCRTAGGDVARPADLCQLGRAYLLAWGGAEEQYAKEVGAQDAEAR